MSLLSLYSELSRAWHSLELLAEVLELRSLELIPEDEPLGKALEAVRSFPEVQAAKLLADDLYSLSVEVETLMKIFGHLGISINEDLGKVLEHLASREASRKQQPA